MPSSWRRSHRWCARRGPILLTRSCSTRRSSSPLAPPCSPTWRPESEPRPAPRSRRSLRPYEAFGPAAPSQPDRTFESLEASAAWLGDALAAGDLDEVDVAATWLGRHASSARLAPLLADLVVPSLAAAARRPDLLVPDAPGRSAGRAHGRAPPASRSRAGPQPELEARVVRGPGSERRVVTCGALRRAALDAAARRSGERLHLSARCRRSSGPGSRASCCRRRPPSTSRRQPESSCTPRRCRCCKSPATTRHTGGATAYDAAGDARDRKVVARTRPWQSRSPRPMSWGFAPRSRATRSSRRGRHQRPA